MEIDKILDKVQKLLKLAESDNINESALAAEMAQKLMHKYNLTKYMVESHSEDKEEIIDFTQIGQPLDIFNNNFPTWKSILANSIAKTNRCRIYLNHGDNTCLGIVGRQTDVMAVRYLYAYLVREIERLSQRDGKGRGKTWFNNFKIGACQEIDRRLKEALDEVKNEFYQNKGVIATNTAMIKLDQEDQDVQNFIDERLDLKPAKKIKTNVMKSAREAGKKAAKEINLNNNPKLNSKSLMLEE